MANQGYGTLPTGTHSIHEVEALTDLLIRVRLPGDAYDRYQLRADGRTLTGSGVVPPLLYPDLQLPFSVPGPLSVLSSDMDFPFFENWTVDSVAFNVGVAPVGLPLVFNIAISNVAVFASGKPTITGPGTSTGLVSAPAAANIVTGNFLSINIEQVGSAVAGADLVGVVRLVRSH